jgi:hypothetical protein
MCGPSGAGFYRRGPEGREHGGVFEEEKEEGALRPLFSRHLGSSGRYMASFTCFTVRVFLPPFAVATVPVASTFFPTMALTLLPFSP